MTDQQLSELAFELVKSLMEEVVAEVSAKNEFSSLDALHVLGKMTSLLGGNTILLLNACYPEDNADTLKIGAKALLSDVKRAMESAADFAVSSSDASKDADDFINRILQAKKL
jgi:hypothetical protein